MWGHPVSAFRCDPQIPAVPSPANNDILRDGRARGGTRLRDSVGFLTDLIWVKCTASLMRSELDSIDLGLLPFLDR